MTTTPSFYTKPELYDNPPSFAHLRNEIDKTIDRLPISWGRVLDVGCGTGKQANAYLKKCCTYTGIDPSPEMIAIAQEAFAGKNSVQFVTAYLDNYQLLHFKYYIVNCCDMLFFTEKPLVFVQQLAEKVSFLGWLVLEADNPATWVDKIWVRLFKKQLAQLDYPATNLNYDYSLSKIKKLLRQRGFTVKVRGVNFLTGMIPYPLSTNVNCPYWVRSLHLFLEKIDKWVAPFFPGLAMQFIITAQKTELCEQQSNSSTPRLYPLWCRQ